jgi:2-keto-4-pentenoate hydratase/2-oxohepta-3-ene-1,7-dioic acid hydratase in catechol pathway
LSLRSLLPALRHGGILRAQQARGNGMKLVTFLKAGEERLGLLAGETVIDPLLATGSPEVFGSALTFIRSGLVGLDAAKAMLVHPPREATTALKGMTLTAPIRPATILCSGSNYRDHNAEKANTPISGKEPEFFVKTADCVVGPNEPIVFDERFSKKIDCETELAIVIGKPGRFIETSRALEHVFGYTIVNDVTARDRQVRKTPEGMTWYELGSGKAFDSGAPLGPCIVTADEIGDPQNLKVMSRINGELRQSSNTSNMIWSCAELIHFFLSKLHAQARHGDHHRHTGRHRVVGRQGARRQERDATGPRPRDALLPARRCRRMRSGEDRRSA